MSRLTVYAEGNAATPEAVITDPAAIAEAAASVGARFERCATLFELPADADPAKVIEAYKPVIESESKAFGYHSVDVVRIPKGAADTAPLRAKFLSEHTHDEDEARIMVEGGGGFYLHIGGKVIILEVGTGDLVRVPAGMKHWFDMGADPHFTAIRLFTRADGWVAEFTGDDIGKRFPEYQGGVPA